MIKWLAAVAMTALASMVIFFLVAQAPSRSVTVGAEDGTAGNNSSVFGALGLEGETSPDGRLAFRPWVCPSGSMGGVVCGFVDAPANHDDPGPDRVRLFVAAVDVPGGATGAPLVVLGDQLGPGTVADLGQWRSIGRALQRAIVLVDLRGTGASEPRASCSEITNSGWAETDLAEVEALVAAQERRRAAVERCQIRVANLAGSPVATVDAMAQDLDLVRRALGVERWVLVAGHQTGSVATGFERRWPEAVDALVMLRAAPFGEDGYDRRVEYAREALSQALDCTGCEAVSFEDLELLVERLEGRSIVVTVPVGEFRERVSANAATLLPTLARSVVDAELRASLFATVDRVDQAEWRSLAAVRGQTLAPLHNGGMA